MDKIIKDYRKWAGKNILIRYVVCDVLIIAAFAFTGMYVKPGFQIAAIILTAGMILLTAWAILELTIIVPKRFAKKVKTLLKENGTEVPKQYAKAVTLGTGKFLEEYLMYFTNGKIVLLRFSEIVSVELKGFKLLLKTENGFVEKMPLGADENPAILVAAMRSKNPRISVILNGKVVESMENK